MSIVKPPGLGALLNLCVSQRDLGEQFIPEGNCVEIHQQMQTCVFHSFNKLLMFAAVV